MLNLFDFSVVKSDFFAIIQYLPVTLEITAFSAVIGLAVGFVLAIIKLKKIRVLSQLVTLFISVIRGTPVIVQLYITYFGIPIMIKYINYYQGTSYDTTGVAPVIYAIVALGLNTAAFNAVTIKSAIESVPEGEIEAAASLGLSGVQRMFRIVIPEAIEVALPSIGNTLIGLVKGTSLAFTCAVVEMTASGKLIAGRDFRYFEAYVALAIIYWIITLVLELIIKYVVNAARVPKTPDKRKGMLWFLKA